MVQGFMLGIASGMACLTCCAPVLVPVLLGEGKIFINPRVISREGCYALKDGRAARLVLHHD
ncbi:MAG: hypothetical protein A4E53_00295 [Pelotomaculum sp. PtaB.Bin104]|nr:MAG: hypothetical protein A4E53_00295 [Pelotomaculum sp. PtaB.Bin104]